MKKQLAPLVLFSLTLITSLIHSTTAAAATSGNHNITHILVKHPGFSTFNHYLTITHLVDEIPLIQDHTMNIRSYMT
ncbi:fasciclin-like arabinogalactan protein, putative [Medicago truncatula]|uniref:Fasciclin-like arabinogalactan protein, putative n=1 Tax=Medicago truncatula TaxID=3880 RepID=G7LJ92_MEDTR|nr:fasciclin-like arabinogalactan protein, putative [Medicago truncatula]